MKHFCACGSIVDYDSIKPAKCPSCGESTAPKVVARPKRPRYEEEAEAYEPEPPESTLDIDEDAVRGSFKVETDGGFITVEQLRAGAGGGMTTRGSVNKDLEATRQQVLDGMLGNQKPVSQPGENPFTKQQPSGTRKVGRLRK